MPRPVPTMQEALSLVDKVDEKFRPVWLNRPLEEQVALAQYFLPHSSHNPIKRPTRPRAVKWYCPFAAQCDFPSGHRYCINVYTGCSHRCAYCYAASYAPETASAKQRFERLVTMDMGDLERFDVPAAPVHLSNSTDPFQPLEDKYGHTRFALEQILEHRNRFTTVTVLTKDPSRAAGTEYVELLRELGHVPRSHPCHEQFARNRWPGFVVEVSLAFWRESARSVYDPGAPAVEDRVRGLRALRDAGIPVVLRIDPLFPRNPLTNNRERSFEDFGLVEPQTIDDLDKLVALAKELGVRHVVYSPAKITQPRGRKLSATMQAMRQAYKAIVSPDKLVFRGGSWRLPDEIARDRVVRPFLELCEHHGVAAKYCKQNLVETP
jgi:DNA repair photolyase